MDDDLRSSLHTVIRVWRATARRMEDIIDDESLTEHEMLERIDAEVSVCHKAMDTIDAEIERALG